MACSVSATAAETELETTGVGEQSSCFSTTLDTTTSSRLNATRIEFERRQLLHSIQLLKLELSQKNLIVDTLKGEHANQLEELNERISDIECEKKLLQHRLKAQAHIYEDEKCEWERKLQVLKASSTQQIISQPSDTASHHDEREEELRVSLQLPLLSEEEYNRLQMMKDSGADISFAEYAQMRVFEKVRPFTDECQKFRAQLDQIRSQLKEKEESLATVKVQLSHEERQVDQVQVRCRELEEETSRLASLVKQGNFKIDNFDRIQSEYSAVEKELDVSRAKVVKLEISSGVMKEERDRLRTELLAVEQSSVLLKQDKEYLSKQVSELTQRCHMTEERCEYLLLQMTEAKQSKEQLYEQFVRSRDEQKAGFERELQRQLEELRARTHLEMDQLKTHTREMYERENRILQESKNNANSERDTLAARLREFEERHQQLVTEYRQFQVSNDGHLSELQAQLQMRSYECERNRLVQQELSHQLKNFQQERDKLIKKVEILSQELHASEREQEVTRNQLEKRVRELGQRLEGYEKIESELDDIVMQAAEMENAEDAERVLFSYGFGTSVPSSSRRRLQQSVQLARRVLKLERVNSSLRQQLDVERALCTQLQDKVKNLSSQLELCQQPQRYLIEGLQQKDKELEAVKNGSHKLEARVRELEKEKKHLTESKNQLSADLERLLGHRQELHFMKQTLLGLQGKLGVWSVDPPQADQSFADDAILSNCPKPTIFTKQDPPSWYKKLQQRVQAHSNSQNPVSNKGAGRGGVELHVPIS